jgi:hypothetical protein
MVPRGLRDLVRGKATAQFVKNEALFSRMFSFWLENKTPRKCATNLREA